MVEQAEDEQEVDAPGRLFFFCTLVTGPRRSLSLKLSDTRVFEPQIWKTNRRSLPAGRDFCIDNLLVRVHLIIVMIRWTGLAPWEHPDASRRPGQLAGGLAQSLGAEALSSSLLLSSL